MTLKKDIVIITLLEKMINQYIYIKNYVYSIDSKKLLIPNETEKFTKSGFWKDFYVLHPGKYFIIEIDQDIEKNIAYRCLTVFTKEDYLSNKRKQYPNANIENFKKIYRTNGFENIEWNRDVPNWIELPRECLPEEEYKQPQEVEDKLSLLLKVEKKKPTVQYLSKKLAGNK